MSSNEGNENSQATAFSAPVNPFPSLSEDAGTGEIVDYGDLQNDQKQKDAGTGEIVDHGDLQNNQKQKTCRNCGEM
jgi:hypothetical protein